MTARNFIFEYKTSQLYAFFPEYNKNTEGYSVNCQFEDTLDYLAFLLKKIGYEIENKVIDYYEIYFAHKAVWLENYGVKIIVKVYYGLGYIQFDYDCLFYGTGGYVLSEDYNDFEEEAQEILEIYTDEADEIGLLKIKILTKNLEKEFKSLGKIVEEEFDLLEGIFSNISNVL
jgi:hypothetical protein